ncbi:MAG: MBL fold metallo-hydrolase, partial [Atribacterota bacterium]
MSNKLVFLGTGPIGGVQGQGKSKRTETSTLLKTDNRNILIDVSGDFKQQAKLIGDIDIILVTHGHQDAIGGIAQLKKFVKYPVPLYTLPKTIRAIKKKFKQLEHLKFHSLKSFKPFELFGVKIIPFKVKHSIQKGFPTLGFQFIFPNNYKLTYISDAGGWNKKVQNLITGSDLLVLDGAMWGKKLIAHLDIKQILPKVNNWGVEKIIFTQIGNAAPDYKKLKQEIKKIWNKA